MIISSPTAQVHHYDGVAGLFPVQFCFLCKAFNIQPPYTQSSPRPKTVVKRASYSRVHQLKLRPGWKSSRCALHWSTKTFPTVTNYTYSSVSDLGRRKWVHAVTYRVVAHVSVVRAKLHQGAVA